MREAIVEVPWQLRRLVEPDDEVSGRPPSHRAPDADECRRLRVLPVEVDAREVTPERRDELRLRVLAHVERIPRTALERVPRAVDVAVGRRADELAGRLQDADDLGEKSV